MTKLWRKWVISFWAVEMFSPNCALKISFWLFYYCRNRNQWKSKRDRTNWINDHNCVIKVDLIHTFRFFNILLHHSLLDCFMFFCYFLPFSIINFELNLTCVCVRVCMCVYVQVVWTSVIQNIGVKPKNFFDSHFCWLNIVNIFHVYFVFSLKKKKNILTFISCCK